MSGDFFRPGLFQTHEAPPIVSAPPYVYFWDRQGRKGQFCRVLARGKMNSCCVEFEDGYKMITSRNAIRRRRWRL